MEKYMFKNIHISFLTYTFVKGLSYGLIIPSLRVYYKHIVKNDSLATFYFGLSSSIYPVSSLISSLILGYIYDRTRQLKFLLIVTTIIYIIGNIIYAVANTSILLLIGSFLTGCYNGLTVIIFAEVSKLGDHCTRGASVVEIFHTAGIATAGLLTTFIIADIDLHIFHFHINDGNLPALILICISILSILMYQLTLD